MIDFQEHVIFLGNCSIVKKMVPIFDDLNDSYINGWFLGVVSNVASDAYICWMTYSKIFCSCFSFSQSCIILVFQGSFSYGSTNLGFWLLVAIIKTMLTTTSSFSIMHGRLCFETSPMQLIYVDNHKSCILGNCKWNNNRSENFFDFGSPVFHGFHMFLSLHEEKLHLPKLFFSLRFIFGWCGFQWQCSFRCPSLL